MTRTRPSDAARGRWLFAACAGAALIGLVAFTLRRGAEIDVRDFAWQDARTTVPFQLMVVNRSRHAARLELTLLAERTKEDPDGTTVTPVGSARVAVAVQAGDRTRVAGEIPLFRLASGHLAVSYRVRNAGSPLPGNSVAAPD